MTRPRSLRSNFSVTAVGGVVYAACQFGMLSVLAQATSPVEVGRYALALAVTGPFYIFVNLKLRQVLATDARGDYSFAQYLAQRISTTVLATLVVAAALFAAPVDRRTATTIAAVAAFKALESIIDILYGAMQRREHMQLIARSQIGRGLGGLVVFSVIVLATRRVELAAIGLVIFTVPPVATNLLRVHRLGFSVRPEFSRVRQWRLTWLALPLGVSVSAGALAVNVPRYFIQTFEGSAALGIFAALAYVLSVTGTIIGSLAQAASPRMANLFASGKTDAFRRTLRRLVLCGVGLGISGVLAVLLFGEPALGLAFGEKYAARNDVMIVLMISAGIQYSVVFLGTAVNAIRRFTVQMPISLGALAAVTVTAVWTVPAFGLMGGAIALLAGQVLSLVCYVWLHYKVVRPALSEARP